MGFAGIDAVVTVAGAVDEKDVALIVEDAVDSCLTLLVNRFVIEVDEEGAVGGGILLTDSSTLETLFTVTFVDTGGFVFTIGD